MKDIRIIFCISMFILVIGGNVQATELPPATPPNGTTQTQQTLTVVFAEQEGVFTQLLTTPVSASQSPKSSGMTTGQQQVLQTNELQAIPEPSTLVLLGMGMVGLIGIARRKNGKSELK